MKPPAAKGGLSCAGVSLDVSEETFGELRSSADILNDVPALRRRMEEDGYLFLRGGLNRRAVERARASLLNSLAEEDLLAPGYPVDEGVLRDGADPDFLRQTVQKHSGVREVLYSGAMIDFFREFLGGNVRHFDYTWFRAIPRGRGTPPHCDIVYMGRGTRNLFTAWTPFGDLSLEQGGLTILEGSHRQQDRIRRYLERDVDTYCENRPNRRSRHRHGWRFDGALSKDAARLRHHFGGRWLSAEFRMGDVLVFGMATIHAGLDNQTDRIRLSSDSRYQLASEPADERWVGEKPVGHGPQAKRGVIC